MYLYVSPTNLNVITSQIQLIYFNLVYVMFVMGLVTIRKIFCGKFGSIVNFQLSSMCYGERGVPVTWI
jgi:hypothetical protein